MRHKKQTGEARAEEGHWTCVCNEDPQKGRHAREGAGRARQSGKGCSRRGGPSVGRKDVLQFPGSYKSLFNNGVSSRR